MNLIQSLKTALRVITRREKGVLLLLTMSNIFLVFLETLSLGAVIPIVSILIGDATSFKLLGLELALPKVATSGQLIELMGWLVILYIVKHLFSIAHTWFQTSFYSKLSIRLSKDLLEVFINRPYSYHTKHSSAELITKTQSANLIIAGVIAPTTALLGDLLLSIGIVVLLVSLQPLGALAAIALFGLIAFAFQFLTGRYINAWGRVQVRLREESLSILQSGFGGLKELKVLGRTDSIVAQFAKTSREMASANRNFLTLQSMPRMILETTAIAGICLLTVSLTLQGRPGKEVIPVLALFAAGAFRVIPAVNRFVNAVQQIKFAQPVIENLSFDFPVPYGSKRRTAVEKGDFHRLEVRQVSFSHEERSRTVLSELTFELVRGQSIGIMGESGAGKSTLIDLILGLLVPERGQILVNGTPINENLAAWHAMVGYVPQSVFIADASIRSNIAFGLEESVIDNSALQDSLRLAQIEQFVDSLPMGPETLVGERGVRLSGGQRQRLGIARALYHRPQVLLLDEATSALDSETEASFIEDIYRLRGDYTLLTIAHRKSTLKHCDQVFILVGGALKEIGSELN